MSDEHVTYTKEDGLGIVTLNRPDKMNAVTYGMLGRLGEIVKDIKNDDEIRCVILTGNGRAFSAGTDISEKITPDPGELIRGIRERNSTEAPQSSWMFTSIAKPVICALNGVAVGVGSELALQSDVRIAAESARFGQVFVHRGIVPDTAAGTYLLPRLVGISNACDLIFSGKIIDAKEMLRIGLVSQVVPDQDLMDTARKLAKTYMAGAPISIQFCKQLIYRGLERSIEAHQISSRTCLDVCFQTEDFKEGITSFFEKRPPQWKGK
jgi:2-(1,2-epoxy-1,2-dihydrophenyl)acetyl-CoA isomerase